MTPWSWSFQQQRPAVCVGTAAIAMAAFLLAGVLQARVPPKGPDMTYLARDAELYIKARTYFPDDIDQAAPRRVFRLTHDQLDLTVKALLPRHFSQSVKSILPRDPLQMNYEYADMLAFNAANLKPYADWVGRLAAAVRRDPTGVIDCPHDRPQPDCLAREARRFIAAAYRGAGTNVQVDKLVAFYAQGVERNGYGHATGDLVEIVLNSPHFLFRQEVTTDAEARLRPAQMLQFLTYTLADVPPHAFELTPDMTEPVLSDSDKTLVLARRMLDTPPARQKLVRFFKAWLEMREPADFAISNRVFPEFDDNMAETMVRETDAFLTAQLATPSPSLKAITQTPQARMTQAASPASTSDRSSDLTTTPSPLGLTNRLGIFSQPAVIASHSGPTTTRLIKRGVFWARKVMCMELAPPPKGLDITLAKIEAVTERQRVEQSTSKAACIGCHKVIDPFGFMLENYDALGRWRTQDSGHAIDASIAVDFLDEGPVKLEDPLAALRTFTASMMFKQCFVRQLFRYYMGRSEEPGDDALLRSMLFEFAEGDRQDILGAVAKLASEANLRRR